MEAFFVLVSLLLSCAGTPPTRVSAEPVLAVPRAPAEPVAPPAPLAPAAPSAQPLAPPHLPPRHADQPQPPQEISGEGPCTEDADCTVSQTRTCCGCLGLSVLSRRHKPTQPEACGCAYLGETQLKAMITGEPGPCGPMPPPASDYRATCRAHTCVAIHR